MGRGRGGGGSFSSWRDLTVRGGNGLRVRPSCSSSLLSNSRRWCFIVTEKLEDVDAAVEMADDGGCSEYAILFA